MTQHEYENMVRNGGVVGETTIGTGIRQSSMGANVGLNDPQGRQYLICGFACKDYELDPNSGITTTRGKPVHPGNRTVDNYTDDDSSGTRGMTLVEGIAEGKATTNGKVVTGDRYSIFTKELKVGYRVVFGTATARQTRTISAILSDSQFRVTEAFSPDFEADAEGNGWEFRYIGIN
jgi:hypothetical protein